MNAADESALRYLTVRVSGDGIAEMDRETPVVFLSRDTILEGRVCRGTGAERPALQLVCGLIVFGLGLLFTGHLLLWFVRGGRAVDAEAFGVSMLPLGVWLIGGVVRQTWFLAVQTRQGPRKVVFKGRVDAQELSSFVAKARGQFGYLLTGPDRTDR